LEKRFIQINDRVIRLDSIAFIDFLDSGRAMIFVMGVSQEKQHISVDIEETRRLRAFMETVIAPLPTFEPPAPVVDEQYLPKRFNFARA
jgi:hypothetical protein